MFVEVTFFCPDNEEILKVSLSIGQHCKFVGSNQLKFFDTVRVSFDV